MGAEAQSQPMPKKAGPPKRRLRNYFLDPRFQLKYTLMVVVVAVVVVRRDHATPSLDQLRDHVRTSLPAYCAPRLVTFREDLPRTSLGKLARGELAEPDR